MLYMESASRKEKCWNFKLYSTTTKAVDSVNTAEPLLHDIWTIDTRESIYSLVSMYGLISSFVLTRLIVSSVTVNLVPPIFCIPVRNSLGNMVSPYTIP